MTQGIYLNVSRRNDDLPEMIETNFNESKISTNISPLRKKSSRYSLNINYTFYSEDSCDYIVF